MIRNYRVAIQTLLTAILFVALIASQFSRTLIAHADGCQYHSTDPSYPSTQTYEDPSLYVYGTTEQCWYGEQYLARIHSFGSQYSGGYPLSQIRAQTDSWEQVGSIDCGTHWPGDLGWVYGQFDAWATAPASGYHPWICTGDESNPHRYLAHTIHYFGTSFTFWTGYN